MSGAVEILNVGEGDVKISFDPSNPQERIRAARIVKDMLRRGYALLVEEPAGSGQYRRVDEFDEETCEYIIADFDPLAAQKPDLGAAEAAAGEAESKAPAKQKRRPGRPKKKRVKAETTKAVSVPKTAGG